MERALAMLGKQLHGAPESAALQRALRDVGLDPTDDRVRALVRLRDRGFTSYAAAARGFHGRRGEP